MRRRESVAIGHLTDIIACHLASPEMPIIEHDLKAFIDTRLIGTRLNVFDPYIFETRYAAGVDTEKGKAALRDPKRSKLFEMMQEQKEDRREHNPLKDIAFAEAGWQIRIKILRQLVDWICESIDSSLEKDLCPAELLRR